MWSSLRAILFDAGGTLVRLDYESIALRARRVGADLDVETLERAEGEARRALDRETRRRGLTAGSDASRQERYFRDLLQAAGLAPEDARSLTEELQQAHRERNLWRVPRADGQRTLAGLRARGLRTAVVSNADGRVAALLEASGLGAHLEFVIDSHLEGVEKPDPEIFRRALARLGQAGSETAYVGDIYAIDVLGARAAGLVPVLIDTAGVYEDADCERITRLGELLDRIAEER